MSTSHRSGERGYTLVEFAVAMSIFVIFMSFATPFMFSQLQGALRTQDRVDLAQAARVALRTMTRELRQAEVLYSDVDKPSGKSELSFGVDFNGDGTINAWNNANLPLEQVTYYLSNDTLYRGRKTGQGSPLAEHVDQVTFELFGSNLALDTDGDGVVDEDELDQDNSGPNDWSPTELANVTRVGITLDVTEDASAQTYSAQAFLRNRVSG
jgi:prepilin-type N-terminal cleavage/methylation domain-containing protein